MKTRLLLPIATCLFVAWLSGCARHHQSLEPLPAQASVEEAAVSDELSRHPELVEESVYDTNAETGLESSTGLAAAVDPLFFWRQILRVERFYEFAFADTDSTGRPTTAIVTVHKRLAGWFNLLVREGTAEGVPVEGRVIRKRLHDHWVRRVLLKRLDPQTTTRSRWQIAALSGVKITSRDAETRLESLRVQSAGLDTTLTDPLAFWRLRRVLGLVPEAEVVLTATTLRPDDVVVLYTRNRRFRFHPNGDNTYTAKWKAASLAGLHHFGVNALSHGTLFDDQAPYDSQAWILPYRTQPEPLAELAP